MIHAKFSHKAFNSVLLTIVIIVFTAGLCLWQLKLLPNFRQKLPKSAELLEKDACVKIPDELKGGIMRVETEVGKGSAFNFKLRYL